MPVGYNFRMIDEIQVKNLALIRDATLEPCAGLTVLTGETGAGKTALLSAMRLLMGARANADMVRDGEAELVVSGRFFGLSKAGEGPEALEGGDPSGKSGDARAIAGRISGASCENPGSENDVVVTRKVTSEGRSRATVNGIMASMRELTGLVAPSIDLCGQFEHQQLMRPATHVSLLDAWAGDAVADAHVAYANALATAKKAAAQLARVQDARKSSTTQLDEARFVLARIDEVNPLQGEYEQLAHDLELAEHSESLAIATATAHSALSDDSGAIDALNTAASALESVGGVDASLAALAESLREVGFVLEDVSRETRDYRDGLEFDPAELAFQQERFANMQGLMRAYGPRMEDVFARRAEAADLVSLADDSDARLREAQETLAQAEAALERAAEKLDAARLQVAPRFAAEVSAVMGRLQMGGAELVCAQERLPRDSWSESGPSAFEFMYCPAVGTHPRPLARIASGGEMSRVMLAVKVVLGSHDDVGTLVFDEVDAGVGGAVAVSLAAEIARLAQTHQVIVVTHLAQVAVRGDVHYVVQRAGDETTLERVEGDAREREIARMLSGAVTDTSLIHARELLGVRTEE